MRNWFILIKRVLFTTLHGVLTTERLKKKINKIWLSTFEMNKSNKDSQWRQINNNIPQFRNSSAGPKNWRESRKNSWHQTLVRVNVQNFHAKCASAPVWHFENNIINCCMRILSKMTLLIKISLLETLILGRYLCIFLPKSHCKLNFIEMLSFRFIHS